MSKDMIIYKENIFSKIKNFFKKIFNKKSDNDQNIDLKVDNKEKVEEKTFTEQIIIRKDRNEIEIEKLQEDFKQGNIFQEDIADDKKEKLIKLYKKQNEELKDKINKEKNEIKKILDDLKAS